MAEIDVKFMKANKALAKQIGLKIKPDKKKTAKKTDKKK